MATVADNPDQEMTAEKWFNGGQSDALEQLTKIKNPDQRKEALLKFNDLNNSFSKERLAPAATAAAPGQTEKAKNHPAIDAAIGEAMTKERGWMADIKGMTDQQLQDRYMDRALKQDIIRNRVDSRMTLGEYKDSRPDLVEIAGKFPREQLERKEVLSRMVLDRRFSVSRCKIDHERKLNPDLVAIAEKNIAGRNLRGHRYNDALFQELGSVKKTMASAETLGFKR